MRVSEEVLARALSAAVDDAPTADRLEDRVRARLRRRRQRIAAVAGVAAVGLLLPVGLFVGSFSSDPKSSPIDQPSESQETSPSPAFPSSTIPTAPGWKLLRVNNLLVEVPDSWRVAPQCTGKFVPDAGRPGGRCDDIPSVQVHLGVVDTLNPPGLNRCGDSWCGYVRASTGEYRGAFVSVGDVPRDVGERVLASIDRLN